MAFDNQQIEGLAKDFISESISGQNPAGLCFPTSFLLQVYLATKQIKSTLTKGKVAQMKFDGTPDTVAHYWLQIDSTDTIVDATIQQFKNPEPIYVGKIQDNQITRTYVPNELEFTKWFPVDFGSWKGIYEESTYPLPLDGPFEKRSITYVIKLATILYCECKKMKMVDEYTNHLYGLYLGPIYCFLYNWQKGIIKFEISKENMPAGFDSLLQDVTNWGNEEIRKQEVLK